MFQFEGDDRASSHPSPLTLWSWWPPVSILRRTAATATSASAAPRIF